VTDVLRLATLLLILAAWFVTLRLREVRAAAAGRRRRPASR